jgi:hypothetical protein
VGSLSAVRIWAFAEIASRALSRPSVVRPLMYDLRDACGRAVSLPAVDVYAQSRLLQPVLRASETAAPVASVPKAPPAEGVSVLSHSPTEALSHSANTGLANDLESQNRKPDPGS